MNNSPFTPAIGSKEYSAIEAVAISAGIEAQNRRVAYKEHADAFKGYSLQNMIFSINIEGSLPGAEPAEIDIIVDRNSSCWTIAARLNGEIVDVVNRVFPLDEEDEDEGEENDFGGDSAAEFVAGTISSCAALLIAHALAEHHSGMSNLPVRHERVLIERGYIPGIHN